MVNQEVNFSNVAGVMAAVANAAMMAVITAEVVVAISRRRDIKYVIVKIID
jgi:nitrate/TMAO reductase-like tetraheme cytochrome c subunit